MDMLKDVDGNWVSDPNAVKSLMMDYWKSLFQEEGNSQYGEFMPNSFPHIPRDDWNNLTRPYSPCEIKASIMSIKPYKAPGPDGFQSIFLPTLLEPASPISDADNTVNFRGS